MDLDIKARLAGIANRAACIRTWRRTSTQGLIFIRVDVSDRIEVHGPDRETVADLLLAMPDDVDYLLAEVERLQIELGYAGLCSHGNFYEDYSCVFCWGDGTEVSVPCEACSGTTWHRGGVCLRCSREAAPAPYALLRAEVERLKAERDAAVACLEPTRESLKALRKRYTGETIPPCCVCGAKLSLQSAGGGPTVYGCCGFEDDPERPGHLRPTEDRAIADEHYRRSRYVVYRDGDEQVIALIDAVEAALKADMTRTREIAQAAAKRERERAAQHLEAKADSMEQQNTITAATMARIYRDEAAQIRALPDEA